MKCLKGLKRRLLQCGILLLLSHELLLLLLFLSNYDTSVAALSAACALVVAGVAAGARWWCSWGHHLLRMGICCRCLGVEIRHGYDLSLVLSHCISIPGLGRLPTSRLSGEGHVNWHVVDVFLAVLAAQSSSSALASISNSCASSSVDIRPILLV